MDLVIWIVEAGFWIWDLLDWMLWFGFCNLDSGAGSLYFGDFLDFGVWSLGFQFYYMDMGRHDVP